MSVMRKWRLPGVRGLRIENEVDRKEQHKEPGKCQVAQHKTGHNKHENKGWAVDKGDCATRKGAVSFGWMLTIGFYVQQIIQHIDR